MATKKPMRTLIQAKHRSCVFIRFADDADNVYEYNVWAPSHGGYVRFNGDKQLCVRLGTRGAALRWDGQGELVALVRREYRAMRAAERKGAR